MYSAFGTCAYNSLVAQYTMVAATARPALPSYYQFTDLVSYKSGTVLSNSVGIPYTSCPLICSTTVNCIGFSIDLGSGSGI